MKAAEFAGDAHKDTQIAIQSHGASLWRVERLRLMSLDDDVDDNLKYSAIGISQYWSGISASSGESRVRPSGTSVRRSGCSHAWQGTDR